MLHRLGNCEVCDAKVSKYTCPRCEVKSCSLDCVNIHKIELECDGLRSKTLYKPLKKYSNLDLLSGKQMCTPPLVITRYTSNPLTYLILDYRLLEDVSKLVTKYHRDVKKRYTRYQQPLPIVRTSVFVTIMKRTQNWNV